MRLITLFFLTAVLSAAADDANFTPIFDGKTFDGWDGKPGAWEIRDGEIWCTGASEGKNWLIYRKDEPDEFILRLEFLWEKGNSGVQVRSDDLGDWQIFGYQVEVAQQDVMGLWHHSLLPKDHPKKEERHLMALAGEKSMIALDGKRTKAEVDDPEKVKANYKEKEWNTMEIICKGNTLTQKINGVVFSTLVDQDSEMSRGKGVIALQDHGRGCIVAYRKIEIQYLESD